ncbi:hypothetical protein [Sorangium sp. So ce1151]|uniref:hypothetical protein n=1 Tax=Sorangium sp. So ce1151 TaxID=3133332 RepID=UPI003F5E5C74
MRRDTAATFALDPRFVDHGVPPPPDPPQEPRPGHATPAMPPQNGAVGTAQAPSIQRPLANPSTPALPRTATFSSHRLPYVSSGSVKAWPQTGAYCLVQIWG